MTKSSQTENKADASSKSKPSYSINVLPPTDDKLKNTNIEANSLKRKSPSELISNQLKRGKPEEPTKTDSNQSTGNSNS